MVSLSGVPGRPGMLASLGRDGTVRFWDVVMQQRLAAVPAEATAMVASALSYLHHCKGPPFSCVSRSCTAAADNIWADNDVCTLMPMSLVCVSISCACHYSELIS